MKYFLTLLMALFFISSVVPSKAYADKDGEFLRYLPVQEAGRIKPYDTMAKEVLEIVYGKKSFKFPNEKKTLEAYVVVFTWMLTPEAWKDQAIFEIKNHQIKKVLDLPLEQNLFKGDEVFAKDNFQLLRQELDEKRKTKEKLTPYFQALQRLENQFFIFSEIAAGQWLKVLPNKSSETWVSVAELPEEGQKHFVDISRKFAAHIAAQNENASAEKIQLAAGDLDQSVKDFKAYAQSVDPSYTKQTMKVGTEVHFNLFHPFRWAYICYLLAALILMYVWLSQKPVRAAKYVGWFFIFAGFALHTYGFLVRVYIAERPPVSNMYETVVWAAWGALVFAFVLERVYKSRFIIVVGALLSVFALVIADSAPAVLDPSLQPLEAVLRSNYWLVVHVMTITISYAAFLLAYGLGNLGLIYYLKDENKNAVQIKSTALAVYRSIQIGVAFLTPGIILGGIWADYSWGRFWGWDPKETWALIALLGYLAILHGRLVGWVKDFGMVASGIITFALVVMAWYGVNFVLGAGLHSYGFGAGGVEYVSGFIFVQIVFVVYVYVVRKLKHKKA